MPTAASGTLPSRPTIAASTKDMSWLPAWPAMSGAARRMSARPLARSPGSEGGEPTADRERLTGDAARVGRAEVAHQLGDLARLEEAIERDLLLDVAAGLLDRLPLARGHLGEHVVR